MSEHTESAPALRNGSAPAAAGTVPPSPASPAAVPRFVAIAVAGCSYCGEREFVPRYPEEDRCEVCRPRWAA